MAKPKILISSQSPVLCTGYSIITRNIAQRLHDSGKYEVAVQGWHEAPAQNPRYKLEAANASLLPYRLFHAGVAGPGDGPQDNLGKKTFGEVIDEFNPDLTILYGDIFMLDWITSHSHRDKTKIAMYYPIDGLPIPQPWVRTLNLCDYIIPFSKFGETATKEMLPSKPVTMIPHGIDYKFWSTPVHPAQVQMKKMEMFGNPDVFIIASFDRNQPRKNLPAILEAFTMHVKDHPKSRLLLHMSNVDQGWNMMQLAHEFNIKDKIYITPNISAAKGIPDQEMRLLYNCCDLMINTAWGEGFGMNLQHGMTCGVPQYASDYSTTKELIVDNDAGAGIPVPLFTIEPMTHIRRAQIHPRLLGDMLNYAYNNKAKLKEQGKNGQKAMASYDWDTKIMPMWFNFLDKALAEPKIKIIKPEVL